MALEIIPVVNLILCTAIFILGLFTHVRQRSRTALYIAVAFALFGISHIATILGLQMETELVIIRIFAYLCVLAALFLIWIGECTLPAPKGKRK
ncbi:MAG: hypothetical protein N3H30_02370 [Candidatus Micrarchaeota archaeon]|nr:hypothetical protein [Candidatus Micrarchaeota archaeon]